MLHADILTSYLICGASAALAALMLRLMSPPDRDTQGALRDCGLGFWVLALGMLPAGLPELSNLRLTQWTLGLSALVGMVAVGSGLGSLHHRRLPRPQFAAITAAMAAALSASAVIDALLFGRVFAWVMLGAAGLMVWLTRDFVGRPRSLAERLVGWSMLAMLATSAVRAVTTALYEGPMRGDLMYVPEGLNTVYGLLYGVMPMNVAILLQVLVNQQLHQRLQERATTDELTATLTRRALREQAPALLARERGQGQPVAVLMLDLDRFKSVNDQHGHATGDAVLRMASTAFRTALIDHGALLARYGGEEFAAVLPVPDLAAARRIAERLRTAVELIAWDRTLGLVHGMTVSVGVALVLHDEDLDQALCRADAALYRAKREGRNQCQVALSAA